jgi:hypothetical protein
MSSTAAWMALVLTAAAVEVPWGKGESLGEKKVLGETTVCTDGKSHFVVVAPHEERAHQLFYGDGKSFLQVRMPAGNVVGSDFFEPRYPLPTANPSFRGVDMRIHSTVEVSNDGKSCQVRCGERRMQLAALAPEEAKAMLLGARYQENPQQFAPHAFLRDDQGTYYLVERGVRPGQENRFRVWVGLKGKLVQQKMVNVVSDSEGQIFSTQRGELRLIVDRVQPSVWVSGKRKTTLRLVPVEENWTLIYNELGVYRGVRLGTPCDDL